jgi:hypothetical protein
MASFTLFESKDGYRGLYVDGIEDWSQFFESCNWYTFRFCHLEFEWDRIMGGIETTIVILGVGIRIRYNYAETENVLHIKEQVDELTKQIENPEDQ